MEILKPGNIIFIALIAYLAVWGGNKLLAATGHSDLEA